MIGRFLKQATKKLTRTVLKTQSRAFAKMSDSVNVDEIAEVNKTNSIDPNDLEVYNHQVNFNREEFKGYTPRVNHAKQQRDIISELQGKPIVNRRQKYVYDKPKYDTNMTGYDVFRELGDSKFTKEYPHEYPVSISFEASPADMFHAFGDTIDASRNDNYSTKEWDFVDSNLDKFLVYDYKSSTDYWGENMSDNWYAQNHNRTQRMRRYPSISPEEFWKSTKVHTFRVNSTPYAHVHKFKIWILKEIEDAKGKKSYEDAVFSRYGDIDLMDDFNGNYKIQTSSPIFSISRQQLNAHNKKWKAGSDLDLPFVPGKLLDDKHLIVD